jgi:cobyrinic acid a,c-diamide synthase
MSPPALLVSAIASGQGKTTATAALARFFLGRGQRVRVFKAGADFLDSLILERAAGHPVHVLDLWMVGEDECRRLLGEAAHSADLVLVEGFMGLYDGTPSSADLARVFDLDVLAVIDVGAMAQTVGAVALGLRDFGKVRLAGVIANGVAGRGHAAMVSAALEDIPLLASMPRQMTAIPERHLGLHLPDDAGDLEAHLGALAGSLDLDTRVWERIAADAASRPQTVAEPPQGTTPRVCARRTAPLEPALAGRHVAVARDAAFAFLYPANLECLEHLGAAVSFFSPLADEPVPEHASAVYLPGGYPELHAARLSGATRFHESIRAAHAAGMPILAECGGMMALAESLSDDSGRQWPMAGLLPGRTRLQPRLAALGLQSVHTKRGEIRGHTFHYSTFETPLAAAAQAVAHPRGGAGETVYRVGALTASYFHAYFNSCPPAVAALLTGADP